jgi:hypothetical protein
MGELIFQADSEKLTKLGSEIRSNDENLINYVSKIEEALVDLGHSWKDQSYYVYGESLTRYLNQLVYLAYAYENLASVVISAVGEYNAQDEHYEYTLKAINTDGDKK